MHYIVQFNEAGASEFGRYAAEFEAARGTQGIEAADVRDLEIAAITRSQMDPRNTNTAHFRFV